MSEPVASVPNAGSKPEFRRLHRSRRVRRGLALLVAVAVVAMALGLMLFRERDVVSFESVAGPACSSTGPLVVRAPRLEEASSGSTLVADPVVTVADELTGHLIVVRNGLGATRFQFASNDGKVFALKQVTALDCA